MKFYSFISICWILFFLLIVFFSSFFFQIVCKTTLWHLLQKSSNIRPCRYYFLLAVAHFSCRTTFSFVIFPLIFSLSHFTENNPSWQRPFRKRWKPNWINIHKCKKVSTIFSYRVTLCQANSTSGYFLTVWNLLFRVTTLGFISRILLMKQLK